MWFGEFRSLGAVQKFAERRPIVPPFFKRSRQIPRHLKLIRLRVILFLKEALIFQDGTIRIQLLLFLHLERRLCSERKKRTAPTLGNRLCFSLNITLFPSRFVPDQESSFALSPPAGPADFFLVKLTHGGLELCKPRLV